jgi:pyrroloquinoline quinone biosynthesis protein B
MKKIVSFLCCGCLVFFLACESPAEAMEKTASLPDVPYLWVLGVAQDAGYPQAGCQKDCCRPVWAGKIEPKLVSCLALVNPFQHRAWLFDATPDFREQLHQLDARGLELAGIFLTHAHIGHYTGLMQLGHEVMGAREVPVYAMPRLRTYLAENGPWSQLVNYRNIVVHPLEADSTVRLPGDFRITPFLVPHRDEYSETVGYRIEGPGKSAIFIPDIDKWERWDRDINEEIQRVDYAFLDATFYANGEIPGRDMSEIPHPFMEESMNRFDQLPTEERKKVYFIHFNHTNPVLREDSEARWLVLERGYGLAEEGQIYMIE